MGLRRTRDVEVTREQVHAWLQTFDGQIKPTKKMKDYLEAKFTEAGIDPRFKVDTTGNDSLPDKTKLVDMILMDIESYA
jgi:hypothetical protein